MIPDSESIKKMLRAVLQSSKEGVSVGSLQSDYQSLCGESIPLKMLGFSTLEDYLQSIPSVVRLERQMGELKCFAEVCKETEHIAQLVAKQKSSKKSGCSKDINCRMRFKSSNPYMLNGKQRSSLRQPATAGTSKSTANRLDSNVSRRGFSASGDDRRLDPKLSSITPVEHRTPVPQRPVKKCVLSERKEKSFPTSQKPSEKPPEQVSKPNESEFHPYCVELVQSRISKLLQKYCSGLWMSKLSEVYSAMFSQKLHPQVLIDLNSWTHICMVEKPSSNLRADRLIYPPLPPKRSPVMPPCTSSTTVTTSLSSRPSTPEQPSTTLPHLPVPKPRVSPSHILAESTFIFPHQSVGATSGKPLSSPTLCNSPGAHRNAPSVNANDRYKEYHNLPLTVRSHKQNPQHSALSVNDSSPQPDPDILPLLKLTFPTTYDSAPSPLSNPPAAVLSAEVHQQIKELLCKNIHGLWAPALPKLFTDTYKMPFPDHILDNLSLLMDICTVVYPVPHDKTKAILYYCPRTDTEVTDNQESRQGRSHLLPSGLEVLGPALAPCLVLPSQQYPSVLITDVKSSNAVTIRYVGEDYSNALEAMEETMQCFYSQNSTHQQLFNPLAGQMVAIRGEDGDEVARGQVLEVMAPDKVKVYYVDHGFSLVTCRANLLELHQDFFSLPFQAMDVRLAGLEAFNSHPLLQSFIDKLAVGKILLMETLEPCQQNEVPVVVLYDTSQDDDVNINSLCLKTLQDMTMNNSLTPNATYQGVRVTNVCPEGIIYCQLPSRGTARLGKLMEETDIIFNSQMTSKSLVSRPFCGKVCLARYKGNWSRVEITSMHGNRVMEIIFIDWGVPATVEVTDLREIPPFFFQEFAAIPPQATKCRLADVEVPEGDWSPEAVEWLKDAVLNSEDCKIKILKLDQDKEDWIVYIYLFIGTESQELVKSINHQLNRSELWNKLLTPNNTITSVNKRTDKGLTTPVENMTLDSSIPNPPVGTSPRPIFGASSFPHVGTKTELQPLPMPPPLELPQPGQSTDVFVPVACHPGHFVLQGWQDLPKLVVLMDEMILYYNQTWRTSSSTIDLQKGMVCAAKIDKNWHRVQVKGILANRLVFVYTLDHGKHELVCSTVLQPLIEEFRQLPFQAITAQLAGVTQQQWSEEASMLFRNHVENRALVAQVESVQTLSEVECEPWHRKLTVYLVDTSLQDQDLWIHSIMANITSHLS